MVLTSIALSREDAKSSRSAVNYDAVWEWVVNDTLTTDLRYGVGRSTEDGEAARARYGFTGTAETSFGEALVLVGLFSTQRIQRLIEGEEERRSAASMRARVETPHLDISARVKVAQSRTHP